LSSSSRNVLKLSNFLLYKRTRLTESHSKSTTLNFDSFNLRAQQRLAAILIFKVELGLYINVGGVAINGFCRITGPVFVLSGHVFCSLQSLSLPVGLPIPPTCSLLGLRHSRILIVRGSEEYQSEFRCKGNSGRQLHGPTSERRQ
jgi:hypothetical protein